MAFLSDAFHKEKLDKNHINIQTKYIVGNQILERNTDNSHNDNIENGIRCEKNYYIDHKLVHTEKSFDSRIEYTFISNLDTEAEYTCQNCGMHSQMKDFMDGCPYCGTYYNIDYSEKDLGGKYHYDHVLRSSLYRVITAIIDLIISIVLAYFFIKTTSRTFNSIDIAKIFIYGFILACILYYFFYIIDAYIVLGPIKRYKDRQNQKQIEFWQRTGINKKEFFNNFNYEVRKYYYAKENIIDYDVLDYLEFHDILQDTGETVIQVKANVRIVSCKNGKITSKLVDEIYTMKKNKAQSITLRGGVNFVRCHNCGASVDITKGFCDYCHEETKYLQSWILIKK